MLFLGNSLTAWNELPEMVAALGRARNVPIEFEAVTPGGYDLSDHWNNGLSLERLRAAEVGRGRAPAGAVGAAGEPGAAQGVGARWADEIRANGATPALYGVWPENYRRSALPASIASYRNAAAASGAVLLPAGDAWRIAWRRNAKLKLYGPDAFHPSAMGTYLAALTVYGGLTRTSPVGLPRALVEPDREGRAGGEDRANAPALRRRGPPGPLSRPPVRQRHALGLLFAFLGTALGLVALAAVDAGQWVVAFGAAVIGGWLLVTAFGALRRRR